jgi:hypothetical protein
MNPKLSDIIAELEDVRSFDDDSYLATTHFVIFLLFGCNDAQRNLLSTRANKIIADRQAYALIRADEGYDVVREVEKELKKASERHITVADLNEVHICPVIISESADVEQYAGTVKRVDAYMKGRTIRTEWKSFLVLNTLAENAGKWLDAVAQTVRELGTLNSCRCCVLTDYDEINMHVAEERLLTTLLFVAFLNVVPRTRTDIGSHIAYRDSNPEKLFYTAQTAFIENPVVSRILKRMTGLLERFRNRIPSSSEVDMGFMQEILKDLYENMPHEGRDISFLPLFSVIPGEDPGFSQRLKSFANKYYLSRTEVNKKKLFSNIASHFLKAHIKAGLGAEELKSLVGNEEGIEKLSKVQNPGISIVDLPDYPMKTKDHDETIQRYYRYAQWLKRELVNLGRNLLLEFFRSREFDELSSKFEKVQARLDETISEMKGIQRKYSALDVTLPLLNDPDEKWIDEEYNDPDTINAYIQCFCALTLSQDDDEFNKELSKLLEKLYQVSKGLSGGLGANLYMRLVSETCSDVDSLAAKECMARIKKALRFPINQGIGEDSYTYVWGSKENKLYDVWEKHHRMISTGNTLLPLASNERFGVLRVSDGFSRQEILRLSGGVA